MLVNVVESKKKGKRYKAVFSDGWETDFGSAGGSTYIDHGDKTKRTNYIKRHLGSGRENWADMYSAGALSGLLLWGPKTNLSENIKLYNLHFSNKFN